MGRIKFGLRLRGPFSLLRWAPAFTKPGSLVALLEAYYSPSQPLGIFDCVTKRLRQTGRGCQGAWRDVSDSVITEEGSKAGTAEIPVVRQSALNALASHYQETGAVNQTPTLVKVLPVVLDSFPKLLAGY